MTTKEKADATCKFVKEAYCIDGEAKFVNGAITVRGYVECTDSKRGRFWVSHGKLPEGDEKKAATFSGQCQHGRPIGQNCDACGRKH